MNFDTMDRIALALIIIGALNWLLVGLANFDAVAALFGSQTATISRIIYTIIGIAGIWALRFFVKSPVEEKS
ncbi:MAG: hypothetical protein XD50_0988 [Clostridia bacterium 41_269]|nr:MAG: hypothetical protein XD50_0988 [Clostridia bacterium 41_269]